MEEPIVYHAIPDSPASVLSLFSTSKEGIALFASRIVNEVEEGKLDPLSVKLWCKTLTEIADKIDKATKSNQNNEAAKYGEKPFMFAGAEMHYTSTYTEYDYSACGDPTYNDLQEQLKTLKAAIKAREEFLKAMPHYTTMIDPNTGEVVTINPPLKKQTQGVKVSIK